MVKASASGAEDPGFESLSCFLVFLFPISFICFPFIRKSSLLTWTASMAEWIRRPPPERKIQGSNPACDGIFPGRVIPEAYKLAHQAPGIIGLVLGLVGPVSVYCDLVE